MIYQVHVRSFHDGDGDGIGDFQGLTQKLDYVRDLGVTALWLLPFYPSPLRDDGYDIADYTDVHPAYGTLADFRQFLREAHKLDLQVITELVLNHTSDQHPWFQRARRAPKGSSAREFYVWSDTPEKYREARIIFKDFESSNWAWDAVAGAYYWHRFYAHQPDLNYDHPAVRAAVTRVLDFWLDLGVDGLRLDAVPYLLEREGTNCENLPETHRELQTLRRHVDRRHPNRMLLGEANQWPEDAVAYFGTGNECHMAFHFPLMPRLFMAVRMEDRYPIIDILAQTPPIPDTCQWAIFLRNHDELTLEMVTDDERDYMYRMYARDPQARINLGIRRRLAPLLGNDRRRIELMTALLLSLPGTPVVYYGDEIGMGDNIFLGDRNGIRTPMQWSGDRNAGFSKANAQRLFLPVVIDPGFSYEAINVEAQHDNPHSLLWWMRRVIALRRSLKAFGRGTLEFLYPANPRVLVFVRAHGDERILVVTNLSRYAQYVELDLSAYRGQVPVEAFGGMAFPPVGEGLYQLTVGPHGFYWFRLETARDPAGEATVQPAAPRRIVVSGSWEAVFDDDPARDALEAALPAYLRAQRWFGGKARRIKAALITDTGRMANGDVVAWLVVIRVDYHDADPESYVLVLSFSEGARAGHVAPNSVVAQLATDDGEGVLHGALEEPAVQKLLLDAIARRRHFKGPAGEIAATPTRALRALLEQGGGLEPVLVAEHRNSLVRFGDRLILKLFRGAEDGVNPDLEIGLFLSEKARFPHAPPMLGSLTYRRPHGEPVTLAILQGFVASEGDAWQHGLASAGGYLERVMTLPAEERRVSLGRRSVVGLIDEEIPRQVVGLIGTYLESARLLGQRTAEMHLALCSRPEDPAFAPEPFTPFYQRSLYQSMRNLTEQTFIRLAARMRHLPEDVKPQAEAVKALRPEILRRFRAILDRRITALRTRHHGDFHLGQVLWTGRDFVIFDFEGEATRPISTRRIKRSPLRDVAGMIRSFDYAAHHALTGLRAKGLVPAGGEEQALRAWADYWHLWVSSAFLRSYLRNAGHAPFLPNHREELSGLLTVYLLEKAVYELGHELAYRPEWVRLPLEGITHLAESSRET